VVRRLPEGCQPRRNPSRRRTAALLGALRRKAALTPEMLVAELGSTVPLSVTRREDVRRLREEAGAFRSGVLNQSAGHGRAGVTAAPRLPRCTTASVTAQSKAIIA
jgi:hypothetical protein